MIKITERRCSDKIQPNVKVGGYYVVVKSDHTAKGAEALIVKSATGDGKKIRISAGRFGVAIADFAKDAAAMRDKIIENRKKEHPEEFDFYGRLAELMPPEKVARIRYTPYIYALIAVYYLNLCKSEVIRSGLNYKKACNALREAYTDLERRMIKDIGTKAMKGTKALAEDHAGDVPAISLYWQIRNEILRVSPEADDIDIKINATIASLYLDVLFKTERISQLNVSNVSHDALGYTPKNAIVGNLISVVDMFVKEAETISFKRLDTAERIIIAKIENIKIDML